MCFMCTQLKQKKKNRSAWYDKSLYWQKEAKRFRTLGGHSSLTDVVTGKNARKQNLKSGRNINPTRNNDFSTGQTSSNVLFLAFNIR